VNNPADMGYLERGVARALDYSILVESSPWPQPRYAWHQMPFYADHYFISGASPIAWSPNADTYGIAVIGKGLDYPLGGEGAVYVYRPAEVTRAAIAKPEKQDARWVYKNSAEPMLRIASPARTAYIIVLAASTAEYAVVLCDVDGELYPAYATCTGME
jgi:hypothetical protein